MPPGSGVPVCAALCEEVWPKSAPSGDVAPMPLGLGAPTMPPELGAPVCAALWSRPSASISAAARRNFMVFPLFRTLRGGPARRALRTAGARCRR